MGETLTPALRARCRELWGVPIIDVYSAQEVGVIAIECPETGLAMPLVRYVIGDRAEVGRLPDGTRHWPLLGLHHYRAIAPILQYQAVQRALDHVELRLVSEAALTSDQEARLIAVVQGALGYPFRITLSYFQGRLASSAGGKLEEFVCELE